MKWSLLGAGLALAPALAAGFVLEGARWPSPSATVHTGQLPASFANAVAAAAATWRDATGFGFVTDGQTRGACDATNGPLTDGVELGHVDCSGVGIGSRTLALTEWYTDAAGAFDSFGITFSDRESWSVYDGPLRVDQVDFRRVALHELGHVLGLDHEEVRLAIMNPTIGDVDTLQPDDIDGVAARYPELRRIVILAPSGEIEDPDPLYQWEPVQGATAYGFKLEPPGGAVIREKYTAAELGCAGGFSVCSLRRGGALGPGAHTFRVYAEADGTQGKWWSMTFTRSGPSLTPGEPALIAPSGTLAIPTPDFVWSAVAPVTDYRLEITPPGGSAFYTWLTAAAAGCAGGEATCSVPSPRALGQGAYRFRVQGSNGSIRGPWSAPLSFDLALLPAKPVLLAPIGSVAASRPAFVWGAVATATSYRLHVKDALGNVTRIDRDPATLGCDASSPCALSFPTELPNGTATVWVQASNAFGRGPWSDEARITIAAPVVLPGATALLAPPPSVGTRRPDVVWTPASGASSYFLRRVDPLGRATVTQVAAAAAGCVAPDATACRVVPSENWAYGAHTLQVRGRNIFGNGPWSAPLSVTVERPPTP
jgi:hypothetical protein